MSRPLRLVITDDQPPMRAGFRAVLEASGEMEVVGEAADRGAGHEQHADALRERGAAAPAGTLGSGHCGAARWTKASTPARGAIET